MPLFHTRTDASGHKALRTGCGAVKRKLSKSVGGPAMSQDALAALERAGFPRRDFLKRSGALIVSFSVWGFGTELATARAQVFQGVSPGAPPANQLDSWLASAAGASVTGDSGQRRPG